MATGVPKKARRRSAGDPDRIELTYSGKRSESEVLGRSEPSGFHVAWDGGENRLYFGDNALVLRTLKLDKSVAGAVRLIYIDPPFATQSNFHSRGLEHAYEDTRSGADYLEHLRERLILLRELLAMDGSIYVHLDDKMVFQVKLLMDEVFGSGNFRNCIVRKKCNPKNYTRRTFGNVADYILFYTKSERFVFNRPVEPWTEARAREYQYADSDGRRYMKVPVHAPGVRRGATGMPWRGRLPPPGKHWQYPPATLDEMDARGEIYWSQNGNPRRKVYLDESAGVPVQDIWMEFRDAHNQNVSITGYPTEKNPDLLARIIEASSNAGDLVLDCYAGSGTTLAVASKLGRRWIGADNGRVAFRTILQRFAHGTAPMGDFVGVRRAERDAMPLFPCDASARIRDFKILLSGDGDAEVRALATRFRDLKAGERLDDHSCRGDRPKRRCLAI